MAILVDKTIKTLFYGGNSAVGAARRIAEFDYLIQKPLSVAGFVNPQATQKEILVNYGAKWTVLPIHKTIYDSIKTESASSLPQIGLQIYTNPKHVKSAVLEALKFPKIKLINIFTEKIPEWDENLLAYEAKKRQVFLTGPASTGIISGGLGRFGEIGGTYNNLIKCGLDEKGGVGILAKSGGIIGELLWVISKMGLKTSTAIQLGGDTYPGSTFVDYLELFKEDKETSLVVLAGELGGNLEEEAAEWYAGNKPWPMVVLVSGLCAETLPKGMKFGHAGAKEAENGTGSTRHKMEAFGKAGAIMANDFTELEEILYKNKI